MPKYDKKLDTGIGLLWTGIGSLAGVPARDLSHEEVIEHGGYELLIASKCYKSKESTPKVEEVNDGK